MRVRMVLGVVCVLALAACEREQQGRFVKVDPEQIPAHVVDDPVIHFLDSSHTKAVLRAGQARVYEDRMETVLDSNVKVEFFSRTSGHRLSVLTADSAVVDDRTKDMTARGNVRVVADSSGTTLETPLLMWNNARQKLHSTEFVRIESPTEIIEGYGFESDQNLKNYKIYKVSGIQYPQ